MTSRGERGIWQRRYWEHTIHDDRDFAGSHGLHAFQPGETRLRGAPGGLAAFVGARMADCIPTGGEAAVINRKR